MRERIVVKVFECRSDDKVVELILDDDGKRETLAILLRRVSQIVVLLWRKY